MHIKLPYVKGLGLVAQHIGQYSVCDTLLSNKNCRYLHQENPHILKSTRYQYLDAIFALDDIETLLDEFPLVISRDCWFH